ncbi:MAG: DUF4340 domain-containing protein [Acidobacteriota bacterium]
MKRSTWVLAILAAAVLAAILLWERDKPSTSEVEAWKGRILGGLRADDVRGADRSGFQPLSLQRAEPDGESSSPDGKAAAWRLVAPVEDAADGYAVEAFVDRLLSIRVLRAVDARAKPEDLGLLPPRATWTLQTAEGGRVLEVGLPAPMGEGLYVRVEGKTLLVDSGLEEALLRSPADFRLRDLLPLGSHDVERLTLQHRDGRRLSFRREDVGGWAVTEPYSDWGASDRILALLDDVCLCPVVDFPDEPPGGQAGGFGPPEASVEVEGGGKTFAVDLGGPAPGGGATERRVLARCSGRPGLLAVSLNSLKSLDQPPESFRSLEVFRRTLFEADEVLVKGESTVRIVRDDAAGWRVAEPSAPPPGGDAPALAAALTALEGVRVAESAGGPPAPGGQAVTVVLKGTLFEERVQVRREAGAVVARSAGRTVGIELDPKGWDRVESALGKPIGGDVGKTP